MARKKIDIDPRIGSKRNGLMITRGQIEQLGHTSLKAQMVLDNDQNTLCLGSSQKSREFGNPLNPDQKKRAQQGVWGDQFSIVFLEDIGATDRSTDWADYVFDRIKSHQLPEPTDFYAGSLHEARWYQEHFAPLTDKPSYTRGLFQVWENEDNGKRIHILDRKTHLGISSSEVRTLIERRDPAWRNHVPAKLWDFYEWEYPPELREAINLPDGDLLDMPDYPTGTKGIRKETLSYGAKGADEVLILRADGVWRPRTEQDDAKSQGD
jgi:hypothetical protein